MFPAALRESKENFSVLRRPLQFIGDVSVLTSAFLLAFLPALNTRVNDFYFDVALIQLPLVIFAQFSAVFLVGGYSIIWRYISIGDLGIFIKAALLSVIVLVLLRVVGGRYITDEWRVSYSVLMIDTILGFGGLVGLRVARRIIYEISRSGGAVRKRVRVKTPALFVGAGRTGANSVTELLANPDSQIEVKGFIDNDRSKLGGRVAGIKVLGMVSDIGRFVDELQVEQVVIALDSSEAEEVRQIIDICTQIPVKTRIVPSISSIADGTVEINRIRDVEIEDLLGREPVALDTANLHELLFSKTVMVTGAGGSIGAELVRQILKFQPSHILLVERAEFSLFEIHRELKDLAGNVELIPIVADVCDRARMTEIIKDNLPRVIFHAAAHKHVPLMEVNAVEAVKNNIFGTKTVGELAGEFGVGDFVLISTDKAVNPTSVMGASKRIAEIVIQELAKRFSTNYVAVRFGNVLGSAGSVVPIFREQIRRGESLSVTHRDMTRYFMTIPEAAQLVMQAGAFGKRGEIFILDMGRPVKILDLAEDMIRLSGLEPYRDINIIFTGIRPGEKLFEELEIDGENLVKTSHPKIFIGNISAYSSEAVQEMLVEFHEAVMAGDSNLVRSLFKKNIPESSLS